MSKVLLVEDDEEESRLYQRLLTIEGFDVLTVDNGADCVEAGRTFHPDLILLDIMMPKMNGLDTLDVLHFDPDLKKVPVVVLTNLSDQHYADEAIRRGAVKFITKSNIENPALIQIIRDIMSAYGPKTPAHV
ncbi:MAG TPA: response regulator [Patescibacteria group bacterium]|nr:response regulator [Patescibacteria group bacterium]